ncbi:MAG: glutamyl-tRNA amidotransferase [Lentisphaeria bacterium]|nr:glutamyl-tRNA amidotransferase [Lentisphaeria bacterium]
MIRLAVNGTLMRGLELNKNLLDIGAEFICEAKTKNCYRLYTINDVHPAMYKVNDDSGNTISLEIWELTGDGLISILSNEPPGLCIGKIELEDSSTILGVLGEGYLNENQQEITQFGGWKEYINQG